MIAPPLSAASRPSCVRFTISWSYAVVAKNGENFIPKDAVAYTAVVGFSTTGAVVAAVVVVAVVVVVVAVVAVVVVVVAVEVSFFPQLVNILNARRTTRTIANVFFIS